MEEAFEEGHSPHRVVEPVMMMMKIAEMKPISLFTFCTPNNLFSSIFLSPLHKPFFYLP
jgi:hypothetical protein